MLMRLRVQGLGFLFELGLQKIVLAFNSSLLQSIDVGP